VGRERGYPLGARGSPCDADYEDGSVPLQLPPSCADHLHRSAKRRLSPPGDRMSVQQRATSVRGAFGHHLGPPNCRSVRACAVKPCAFGAPLTRLWGLTARHGQTRGIRALREISMPIADLAGEWATARPSPRPLMPP